jgi:putative sigma-54 modulation protein
VQVTIACRHGHISDEVREYLTRKCEKLLTYFERVTAIGVTVEFGNPHVRTELLVNAEHKHNFVASELGDEVVGTFDRALQKMEQQIRRYKIRIQEHRHDRPPGPQVE